MDNEYLSDFLELQEKVRSSEKLTDELVERMNLIMKALAYCGWYISMHGKVTDTLTIGENLWKGYVRKVDEMMKKYYSAEFDKIIRNLSQLYPKRKKLFLQAAKAHKLKMYYCSAVLFLTQADGICQGQLYYSEKKNLKKRIKKIGTSSVEDFLQVLFNVSAIDAPHSEKDNYLSTLNRHAIVHGWDAEYGTELNSLKALSLLAFIGECFAHHKELSNFKLQSVHWEQIRKLYNMN